MAGQQAQDSTSEFKITDLILLDEQFGGVFISNYGDRMLRTIVELAVEVFGAAAASIALVDSSQEHLIFTVAHGEGNQEVIGKSIPSGIGIAGYVILNGEPIAIEDVHQDTRFYHSFAESTGYIPASILAAPLYWTDEVIGVMEVLDKTEPQHFTITDIALLGLFAKLASFAIGQSQYLKLIGKSTDETLVAKRKPGHSPSEDDQERTIQVELGEKNRGEVFDLVEGLRILRELGATERHLGLNILKNIAHYMKSSPDED